VTGQPERTAEYTHDVRVDRAHVATVRDARDGGGRIPTDARQALELVGIRREASVHAPHDLACRRMEIAGAGVVAEARPRVAHLGRPRGGQRLDARIPTEKSSVVLLDPDDLGLLEHDFRDENAIRVTSLTPREGPLVARVPGEEATPKSGGTGPEWTAALLPNHGDSR